MSLLLVAADLQQTAGTCLLLAKPPAQSAGPWSRHKAGAKHQYVSTKCYWSCCSSKAASTRARHTCTCYCTCLCRAVGPATTSCRHMCPQQSCSRGTARCAGPGTSTRCLASKPSATGKDVQQSCYSLARHTSANATAATLQHQRCLQVLAGTLC